MRYRQFQADIAAEAAAANTLVVLPTGLGKTIIATLVIAQRLATVGGRALVLAPSKPLADQHRGTLGSALTLGSAVCLTGEVAVGERRRRWRSRRLITATPQTALNDLLHGLLPRDISVVVFDEAHRAIGDYAYVRLAWELRHLCPGARFLGLTASPGHQRRRIERVRENLSADRVVLRSRDDPDVAPYVQPTALGQVGVQPNRVIREVADLLTRYYHQRLNRIRRYGFLRDRKNAQVRIGDLNRAAGQVFLRRRGGMAPYLFQASRQVSLARTAHHALFCIERQGVDALLGFLEPKMAKGRSRLDASFVNDPLILRAYHRAKGWREASHPKLEPLLRAIEERVDANPRAKVIVFAELRDTVASLARFLRSHGFEVEEFIGQGFRRGREGMSQDQQRRTLQRFAAGRFQVLCATSIAEEGLDIPEVDLVVFYEPVASDIRLIQRRGRTGRDARGRVVILTTEGTADEAYLRAGFRKEERMQRLVRRMSKKPAHGGGARVEEDEPAPGPPLAEESLFTSPQRRLTDYGPTQEVLP